MEAPYSPDLVVKDGLVVSHGLVRRADVAIQSGKIRAIGRGLPLGQATDVIDAAGRYVLPGAIDAHVHPMHADTVQSCSVGGLHGGALTLLHFIYDDPQRGLLATVRPALDEARATSVADFAIHARLGRGEQRAEIPAVAELGISSFKMFMAYKRRGIQIEDDDLLRIFREIAAVGGLAMVHAENGNLIDAVEDQLIAAGRNDARAYTASRPAIAEVEATNRAIAIAEVADCPLYVVHISAAGCLDHVRRAKSAGRPVFAETCVHYLTLTEETTEQAGVLAKIAPPLRTAADQDALWAAIRDGTVDAVASDHGGYSREEKYRPSGSIWEAGFGAPGVETLLPVVYHAGVAAGKITIAQLVRVLAERPAEVFGIADRKGSIQPDLDADLLIWNPQGSQTITASGLHTSTFYTLYEGWQCQGRLDIAIQRGRVVLRDGQCLARPGDGQFLARGQGAQLPVDA
ncbi:MAG: amidohydrolase family protein [Chloroflexi bacterium]|nr:amidohydrolase family protein [Chloroflexota bacterium]